MWWMLFIVAFFRRESLGADAGFGFGFVFGGLSMVFTLSLTETTPSKTNFCAASVSPLVTHFFSLPLVRETVPGRYLRVGTSAPGHSIGVLDFHTVGPIDGHLSSMILGKSRRLMTLSNDSSSRLRTEARATVSTSVMRDGQVNSNVPEMGRAGDAGASAGGDGGDGGAGEEAGCCASSSASFCSSFTVVARPGSGLPDAVDVDDVAPAALALISASVNFFCPVPPPPPLFLSA